MPALEGEEDTPTPRRGPGRPAAHDGPGGREALLAAARALMAERGLPRVTLREVAARAGVQPALVSYHFGGKDGLLRAVALRVVAETRERMQGAVAQAGGPTQQLERLVHTVVSAFAQDPYAARLFVEQVLLGEPALLDEFADRFARPNVELIAGLLEAGQESGELRDVELRFLMPSLAGLCVFFFLAQPVFRRVFGVGEPTPELAQDFARHTAELLLHGIATPERPSP